MSCYIHAFVEILDDGDDDMTEFFAEIKMDQDYRLFALMAGVRNEEGITPVAGPKGLPHWNLSWKVEEAAKQATDFHSHSWLDLDELETVQQRLAALYKEESPRLKAVIALMDAINQRHQYPSVTRLVFWFEG